MRLFLFFTFSVFSFNCIAQNLVPNPSFEEFTDCPLGVSELENLCENWVGWSESPDYYNVCNNDLNNSVGIPENIIGFQEPLSGAAYSGLGTYAFTDPNIREYIAVELIEELVVGEEYYLMFFASLYDGGSQSNFHCATSHIGLRFFDDPEYDSDFNPFTPDNFAHLDYEEILLDSESWVKIDGWITADQAYNWLAIGNFFTDENTEIEILDEGPECFGIYYIENVCVSQNQSDCDQLLNTEVTENIMDISIYPNPSSTILNIESDELITEIWISDMTGRLVQAIVVKDINRIVLEISEYSSGIYHLKVQTEKGFYTHRIIKQ